jgi:CDP-glucose 4,6-dehydratase
MNPSFWEGKTVCVTGHNGFKGCWLTKWLDLMGANVLGLSLQAEERSSIHQLTFSERYQGRNVDIRNREAMEALRWFQPELVIHLAAQAIVRVAQQNPVDTFETNVMGTVNLLEACRTLPSVKSVVVVTSDKVYENRETMQGYTEQSPLMGGEVYSCSKVAQEQVARAYYETFFRERGVGIATARASNAFGGGDYHFDRLIPYLEECAYRQIVPQIRNPHSVRPWQYVLDLLCGYLTLAEYLYVKENEGWESYNFGPDRQELYSVQEIAQLIGKQGYVHQKRKDFYEANLLYIDSQKSKDCLNWKPLYRVAEGLEMTTELYRLYFEHGNSNELYEKAILEYMRRL